MTLRHLEIFLAVTKTLNMSEAAQQLYITQPSVSQAIRELESHYEVKLFERIQRGLRLTEDGRILAAKARKEMDAFEEMEDAMREAEQHPVVRIGSSVSVGTVLLEHLLKHLEQECPSARVYVTVDNTSRIEKMVENGELDVGVVEGMLVNNSLCSYPVCEDRLVLVAGKEHPFYERVCVRLEELEGQFLIGREEGSTHRNQYELFLERNHIQMHRRWSSTNTEAIKSAVIHGRGLAILSEMMVQKEVEEGLLRIVSVEGVTVRRQIRMFHHKDKYLTPVLKSFVEVGKGYWKKSER